MSTGTINVWVTRRNTPDRISEQEAFVSVLHLDGTILEWCGNRFTGMRTECGHLEVEVPPGCYAVLSVENPAGLPPLGNHLSHIAIVQVGCHERACVTLFNPTMHQCRTWFESAINHALRAQALPAEIARPVLQALGRLGEVIEADPFTERTAELLEATPWQ